MSLHRYRCPGTVLRVLEGGAAGALGGSSWRFEVRLQDGRKVRAWGIERRRKGGSGGRGGTLWEIGDATPLASQVAESGDPAWPSIRCIGQARSVGRVPGRLPLTLTPRRKVTVPEKDLDSPPELAARREVAAALAAAPVSATAPVSAAAPPPSSSGGGPDNGACGGALGTASFGGGGGGLLAVGGRVVVTYGDGSQYRGRVAALLPNGSVGVDYDDGARDLAVARWGKS